MTRHGRAAAAIGVLLLLPIVSATVVSSTAGPRTRLELRFVGLPDGSTASVDVSGPDTFTATLDRPGRDVTPGTYTLRIAPARVPGGRAYAEDELLAVTVPAGRVVVEPVEFVTIVPDTTKILDPTNPGVLTTTATSVTLQAAAAASVQLTIGNILVVAEGPQTPDFLCRRITTLRTIGDTVVATTTTAHLYEAIPQGRIRLTRATGIVVRPASLRRPTSGTFLARDDKPFVTVDFGGLLGKLPEADASVCSLGDQPKLTMDLIELNPQFDGHMDWGIAPPHANVTLTATLNPRLAFNVDLKAAACKLDFSGWDRLKFLNELCGKLPASLAHIGPLTLRCTLKPEVSLDVSAKFATKLTLPVQVTGGVKDSRPDFAVRLDPNGPSDIVQQAVGAVNAKTSAAATLGLRFALEGGDPTGTIFGGLELKLTFGPKVTVQGLSVTAKLIFEFEVNAILDIDPLFFEEWTSRHNLWTYKNEWPIYGSDPSSTPPASSVAPTAASSIEASPEAPVSHGFTGTDWLQVAGKDLDCSRIGLGVEMWRAPQYYDITGDGVPDAFVTLDCQHDAGHAADQIEVFDGASDPLAPRRIGLLTSASAPEEDATILFNGCLTFVGHSVTIHAYSMHPDVNHYVASTSQTDTWNGQSFSIGAKIQSAIPDPGPSQGWDASPGC